MFYGRDRELKLLNDKFVSNKDELIVLYGRRRIGKSFLIKEFLKNKSNTFSFEGIEGISSIAQIEHFKISLKKQFPDSTLDSVTFKNWESVFIYITEKLILRKNLNKKIVIFFDEIQWMTSGRSEFISLLKFYWDNHWKNKNIMLILCGSIASFMVKKIIKSKALYGRITCEILLKSLNPYESSLFFKQKRNPYEILKYLLIFGGVPKYLEEINLKKSFSQNINEICFSKNSNMINEIEKIFYSQFREVNIYNKIIKNIDNKILSLLEISKKIDFKSGGSLTSYISNLENAEFISSYIPFDKKQTSKFKKFRIADEFFTFFLKYIKPNMRLILESGASNIFEVVSSKSFDIWQGFSFERFCIKHALYLSEIMGFSNSVLIASPYFGRNDKKFQIDLLYLRSDNVITICEIKHYNKKITTKIISEVERKCQLIKIPKGFTLDKALISLEGPDKALQESGYFNYYVSLGDLFTKK